MYDLLDTSYHMESQGSTEHTLKYPAISESGDVKPIM